MGNVSASVVLSALIIAAFSMPTRADVEANTLERGRYLVETVAFCGVCHNTRSPDGQMIPGKELAGGRVMPMNEMRTILPDIPPGDIRAVAPNPHFSQWRVNAER